MPTFEYLTPAEAVAAARPDAPDYKKITGLRGVDADRFIPRHERTRDGVLHPPSDPWRAHGHLDRFREIKLVVYAQGDAERGAVDVTYADGSMDFLRPGDLLCVERPVTGPASEPVWAGRSCGCGGTGTHGVDHGDDVATPSPAPALSVRLPIHDDLREDNRTLPAPPLRFPTRIGVYDVIAAALTPSRTDEPSHIALMVLRDPSRPVLRAFSVVQYVAKDDGQWGPAGNGTHDCSYPEAMDIFMKEVKYTI